MSRRIALAILALTLVGALVSATPALSSASSSPTKTTRWSSFLYNYYDYTVPIYGCPSSSCVVTNDLANYSPVKMLYWTDCHWYTGNYQSNRWFYIYYWYSGEVWVGWVHSSHVFQQERTWNWYWNC